MTEEQELDVRLKLSVQHALQGNVTENIAMLGAHFRGHTIVIEALHFTAPTNDDKEHVEVVATEVIADFSAPYMIETRYGLYTRSNTRDIENIMFRRAENPQDD